jgi:hypothetical protein
MNENGNLNESGNQVKVTQTKGFPTLPPKVIYVEVFKPNNDHTRVTVYSDPYDFNAYNKIDWNSLTIGEQMDRSKLLEATFKIARMNPQLRNESEIANNGNVKTFEE